MDINNESKNYIPVKLLDIKPHWSVLREDLYVRIIRQYIKHTYVFRKEAENINIRRWLMGNMV